MEEEITPLETTSPDHHEGQEPTRAKPGMLRDYLFLFTVSGIIVFLDQLTKIAVRTNIPFSHSWMPWEALQPYIRIVHWRNTGAAFGIFQNFGLFFTLLAIVVSIAIIIYFPRVPREDWTFRLALSLQLGGALGNLSDRLFVGEVTDFISVGPFPVFNIADASIFIGVVILIFGMWQKDREMRAAEDAGQVQTGE